MSGNDAEAGNDGQTAVQRLNRFIADCETWFKDVSTIMRTSDRSPDQSGRERLIARVVDASGTLAAEGQRLAPYLEREPCGESCEALLDLCRWLGSFSSDHGDGEQLWRRVENKLRRCAIALDAHGDADAMREGNKAKGGNRKPKKRGKRGRPSVDQREARRRQAILKKYKQFRREQDNIRIQTDGRASTKKEFCSANNIAPTDLDVCLAWDRNRGRRKKAQGANK